MTGIVVQAPSGPGETPERIALEVGQSATVGVCNCDQCDLDLRIAAEGVPWAAGRIRAASGFWTLSNLSDCHPLIVEDMDDWYQFIVIDPAREDVPVPFELGQIKLGNWPTGPKVAVFGFEPRYRSARRRPNVCEQARPRRPLLDPRSVYFSVLKELCGQRVKGSPAEGLPTSAEIADRLRERRGRMSARAVDAHIKYVSEKLRLPKGASREALVSVVIRSGVLHQ